MQSSPELSQNPLKIKQDDKFFSRLLSKENSASNPSFRVYYGNVSGAVPFTWEIQPGTPKHKLSDNSIPPLTPPPSYYFSNPNHDENKHTRSKLLHNLLRNINVIKKGHVASSTPSSLSSSSWSSSVSSAVASSKGYRSRRRRFSSFGSSFDDGNMYGGGSPDSVMCFGMSNNNSRDSRSGGGSSYKIVIMKKALLSIVGRRSG
ncbi:hypothetical protein L1987_03616 [Smallanthus sonchifolius]|uniref:Uncharacterized protein n=1 Tax=Smallanthus sonchifolius TaxID=185202 RepID=A0ACB9KB32_9ASTR|nr:hypothetical protein L1987_03616 [Smallanthus sonchifolius]